MKKYFAFLLMLGSFAACVKKGNNNVDAKLADKTALMEVDKAFSLLSEQKGMKNAFIEYLDSNGVLLRTGHLPIVGANAIDYLIQQNDSAFTLKWEPHFAEAAASGDLGYTYGVYEVHLNAKDTTMYGTYVSIWKKQKDGKWKFVLDTGNEGIENEE